MNAKKLLRGYGTILLFALAATLLIFSTVGSSRAASTYYSKTYGAQVSMLDIGVTLAENGEEISYRNYLKHQDGRWDEHTGALLQSMLGKDEMLQPGRAYPEKLTVRNSGTIDEYVRVTIYRYWADDDGSDVNARRRDLDPGLIDLNLLTGAGTHWIEDTNASTPERTVLYYTDILPGMASNGTGSETEPFADTLTITALDGVEVTVTTEDDGKGNITTKYTYDGANFVLRVDVDAVQTHNAADAILSAWGVNAQMSGTTITGVRE